MLTITLQYYASLREQSGKESESFSLADGSKVSELYAQLQDKYGFTLKVSKLRAAANDNFVSWDYPLQQGDDIVFIPPVGGG